MEEKQRSHIQGHINELIRQTTCHSLFIAFLESKDLLSDSDVSELKSIDNRLKTSEALYGIVTQRSNFYIALCEALKETGQTGALEILERIKPIRYDVRHPAHLFTGREEELDKLHGHLTQNKNIATLITHSASVTGLGGIGKTELCRKYIQNYSAHFDDNVIWITAERRELMENSFRTLAKDYLNISLKDVDGDAKNIQTVVDEVYNYFREKNCLFVFDNAVSSTDEHHSTFLPVRVLQRPHLLITSRDRDWELPLNVLELQELKEAEAVEFVKKGLAIQDNTYDEIILVLVTKLQRFPLAIQQAISFIKEQRVVEQFQIETYLKSFDTESKLLLNHQISPFLSNKYAKTTFTTWKITTDVISADKECGHLAKSILHMISYFEPDKIPLNLLLTYQDSDKEEMHLALQLLVKYSMISCQPAENTVNIHRLVQEVTRIQLKMNSQEDQGLKIALQLMKSGIIGDVESSVYHALSAYKFSVAFKPELSAEFKLIPWKIVAVLNMFNRHEEAETVGKELEPLLAKLVPPDDPDAIRLKFALVNVAYCRQKNLEASLKELKMVLKQFEENKDNSFHESERLSVEGLLGHFFQKQGYFEEALQLSRKILVRQKTLHGENHWRTVMTLADVAYCIWKLGTSTSTSSGVNEEEFKLLQEANKAELSSTVADLKKAHKTSLEQVTTNYFWKETMFLVANCFNGIGEKDYATIILNDVIQRTEFDNERPQFFPILIDCMTLLADIKQTGGKHKEALVIYQNVHSRMVDLRGEKDPETLYVKAKVAESFLLLNEMEASLETYTAILKILETKRELPHPDRPLAIHVSLVNTLCAMERSEESLQKLGSMKTQMETQFGENHPLLETVNGQIQLLNHRTSEADA